MNTTLPPTLRRVLDQCRGWLQRIPAAYRPLIAITLACLILLSLGYGIGYGLGSNQAERAAQIQRAELKSRLETEYEARLSEAQAARDDLLADLNQLSKRVQEQVDTSQASAASVTALRDDLTDMRQRYAALEDRYDDQSESLETAQIRINQLEDRLQAQQTQHDSERSRLRAALLQAGLDGELTDARGGTYDRQLALFEQNLALEREALTTLQRQWQGFSASLITELRDGTTIVTIDDAALFDSGATRPSEEGQARLQELATLLGALPDYGITVEGHTDAMPLTQSATDAIPDNWALSALRAASTVRVLEEAGISAERLRGVGYGSTRPIDDDPLDAANRRVEVILYPPIEQRVLRLRPTVGERRLPDAEVLAPDGAETPD